MWDRSNRTQWIPDEWPLILILLVILCHLVIPIWVELTNGEAPLPWDSVGSTEFATRAAEYRGNPTELHTRVALGLAWQWELGQKPHAYDPVRWITLRRSVVCGQGSEANVPCVIHRSGAPIHISCHGFPPPMNGGGCWRKNEAWDDD